MSRRASCRTIKFYNRDKYLKENFRTEVTLGIAMVGTSGFYQGGQVVVPPTVTQGMRKVKHITISLARKNNDGEYGEQPFFWALVFVPYGYNANVLGAPGISLYEPNQYVMASGIIDPDAGPIRIRSPIARNLNSGDSISLVVGSSNQQSLYYGVVSYAVTLQ